MDKTSYHPYDAYLGNFREQVRIGLVSYERMCRSLVKYCGQEAFWYGLQNDRIEIVVKMMREEIFWTMELIKLDHCE